MLQTILTNTNGLYIIGTSYNGGYIKDVSKNIYPILDFVDYGTIDDLINIVTEFCLYLGYTKQDITYISPNNINILDENECKNHFSKYKIVITTSLDVKFNKYYWFYNTFDKKYKVVALIINGQRVLIGGERMTNIHEIILKFYTIDKGNYVTSLYNIFTKCRIDDEIVKYTNLKLVERFGATINLVVLFNVINENM